MPSFSKIDLELEERIVVINFPYTFVSNDDKRLIDNPSIFEAKDLELKDLFNEDRYKNAFINILFKQHKEYKKSFIIPPNVIKHTQQYFSSNNISSFINTTYCYDVETENLPLTVPCTTY